MESGMERGKSGKEEDGRGSTLLWGVYRISFLLRLLGRILPIVPFNIARFRWFRTRFFPLVSVIIYHCFRS